MPDLKPCSKCGKIPTIHYSDKDSVWIPNNWVIWDPDCMKIIVCRSKNRAIRKWNRRKHNAE